VWSPSGTELLYQHGVNLSTWIPGYDRTRVIEGNTVGDADWSPDQSEIAYLKNIEPDGTGEGVELFRMPARGGSAEQMTDDDVTEWGVSWSPDGEQIAYAVLSGFDTSEIYVIDVETKDVTQVTTFGALTSPPDWRPAAG
jgi:Tol biopolymer transport system component